MLPNTRVVVVMPSSAMYTADMAHSSVIDEERLKALQSGQAQDARRLHLKDKARFARQSQ